ncbi:MAG: PLP-dependent aminotransferase family protein [Pseudomonadota bacterium]
MATVPFPDMTTEQGKAAFSGWLSQTNEVTRAFLAAGQIPGLINIAGGLPEASVYPSRQISAIAQQVITDYPAETLGYGPIEGLPDMRSYIAERFSNDTLKLSADNVLITTSGMQGLDLIGKVLLDEGDPVAVQFPTYLGALDAWRPRQPKLRNMDLQTGDFDPFEDMAGAKFAYTVPNFSNPTGKLIGEDIRKQLVEASTETGAWLLEDDPYGSLNYEGPLPPSALDISSRSQTAELYDGQVVYLGTMSKLASPGLRIGWAIAAPEMIEALTLAKQGSDMCTSGITQRIALEVLKSGIIEENQPKVVELYKNRRDALCAAMKEHLSEWFEWEIPEGGMFVWAKARDPRINTDRLFKIAIEEKVCISPSSVFDAHGKYNQGIRTNFTLNNEDNLHEAVRRLAKATQRLLKEAV